VDLTTNLLSVLTSGVKRTAYPSRQFRGIGVLSLEYWPKKKHFQERIAETADLSTALRFGRDDKGERRRFQGE
jgi:hypothetical protein